MAIVMEKQQEQPQHQLLQRSSSEPLTQHQRQQSHSQFPAPVKKPSLKKQLSFDEKVTEFHLRARKLSEESVEVMGLNKKKVKRIRWWNPSEKNSFAYFCRTTSIHGLQYLGTEGVHFGERVLWGLIFILSGLASLWLIKQVFIKYIDSPVVVTFDSAELPIGKLPFPAVTICNMNRVLKSQANAYIKLANSSADDDESEEVKIARQDVYYLDHVCSVSNTPFSKMFNFSMKRGSVDPELMKKINLRKGEKDIGDVQKFLQKASQPCTEMIKLCMWEGEPMSCKELFRPIETNFGKCCVFNMVPHSLLNRHTVDNRETEGLLDKWGNSTDSSRTENFFKDDHETENSGADGTVPDPAAPPSLKWRSRFPRRQHRAGKGSGLMFLADPALDEYFCTNSDSTGFRLSVHYITDIPHVTDFGLAIRPNHEHFVSVTPDVVLADEVIRSYNTDKRNCYFDGEYPLKYYNLYTSSNCLDECVAELTYNDCGCVRYYMPRDDSRDICSPANFSCAEEVKLKVMRSGLNSKCQHCLPLCTEIRYSAKSSTAPLQRLDLWVDDSTNETAPWAKKNVSIVYVYFGEDSTFPKLRGQLYGITDLIANTGGLLGLCMGFSLLSLVELIFHFTFRPWCRRKQWRKEDQQRSNNTQSEPQPSHTSHATPPHHNGNGHGHFNNGFHHHHPDLAESRRVFMKPGDDGLYHLQNKNCSRTTSPSPSPPPPPPPPFDNIKIASVTEENEKDRHPPIEEDPEDSHL